MAFDIARARLDTPASERLIHFNNAGAALMPNPVVEATITHLQLEASIGGYEAATREQDRLEHVYDAVAALLNCRRDEVAIVENATRAWDMAFYSIPFGEGDRILTSHAEYASNYIALLQVARKTGAVIEVIPNDEHGQISVAALKNAIDAKVKLITLTHVPTNGGLVNPAAEVGKVAREAGVLYLLDACQSAGQIPLDVQEIGCDMLSATGRKYLRGPRGTGFLYVRGDLIAQLEPPLLDLHAAAWTARSSYEIRPDARRFENWEANYAGKIGLGVAIDYALAWGIDETYARIRSLAESLRTRLSDIKGVVVCDLGKERCGIVTFTARGLEPKELRERLRDFRINVWSSPLRYTRLDMEERGINDVVRASLHYYNTEEEVERFAAAIESLL